jgi:zinc transport system substrate-binding protein
MRLILILVSTALIATGAACSPGGAGTEPAEQGTIDVVVSVSPLFEAAQRVGGERAEVSNVVPPGAEPHDVELAPNQVDQLLDADLLLYLGGGFQPAVEDVAATRGGMSVDVLAEVAPEETTDPHIWLDPPQMAEIVEVVAAALTEAVPAGADAYERRAEEFREDIDQLHQTFEEGLADCERRTFVTTHAAFGHLARRYGLVERSIAGLEPESEPDPARLAELEDLIRKEGATTVFTEPLVSPRVAQTLARETGARVAVLDPLEGTSSGEATPETSYVGLMEQNLEALRAALGCGGGNG